MNKKTRRKFNLLRILIFCLIFSTFVTSVFGQTAPQIIQKAIKAIGGEDNFRKISTIVKKGFISLGTDSLKVTVLQINGKAKKTEMEINGMRGYEIINKKQGWFFLPFDGQSDFKEMDSVVHAGKIFELDIPGLLLDYELKGFSVSRLDNEMYESKEYFKIRLFKDPDIEFHFLIDPETDFVSQIIEFNKIGENLELRQIRYDDYRDVGKIKLPFQEENQYGTIKFSTIKMGMKISESVFSPD